MNEIEINEINEINEILKEYTADKNIVKMSEQEFEWQCKLYTLMWWISVIGTFLLCVGVFICICFS